MSADRQPPADIEGYVPIDPCCQWEGCGRRAVLIVDILPIDEVDEEGCDLRLCGQHAVAAVREQVATWDDRG